MSIITRDFGGRGGKEFSMQAVKSVGLRRGKYVDAIVLNGTRQGGRGGRSTFELNFAEDEYIEYMEIKSGKYIDKLTFRTNKKRVISGGGRGGRSTVLNNVRVLGIEGKKGKYLDSIRVKYIQNYSPSVTVEKAVAVIDVVAPGTSIEVFSSEEVQTVVAHTKILEKVFSASVEAEASSLGAFLSKLNFKASTQVTSKEEIRKVVTEIRKNSRKEIFATPSGSVGLEVVRVDVFRDARSNFYWMAPGASPENITIDADVDQLSAAVFDLTGFLSLQVPSLKNSKKKRYGFDFYPKDELGSISRKVGRIS